MMNDLVTGMTMLMEFVSHGVFFIVDILGLLG
jgi:hypothetical protein